MAITLHTLRAPTLSGDEIAEVLQAQAGFTVSTDIKPVLATYGCGPCVALGGYDPTNQIAFLIHFSNAREIIASSGLILLNIRKLAKEPIVRPIQLHLRGGIKEGSEDIIKAIKTWMRQTCFPMEIISEDILHGESCLESKSLLIDSRNGAVSEYDPMTNPKSRDPELYDVMAAKMSAFEPKITVVYAPKTPPLDLASLL
jgi:hypothetical protein